MSADIPYCPGCARPRDLCECGDVWCPPAPAPTEAPNPLATQIGGSHYTDMTIQPMEFSMANKMDACQHTIIKYVSRFRSKNGKQDLEKAKHVIDMLIAFEYGNSEKQSAQGK